MDSDMDGVADCLDKCPLDANKVEEGICGCGVPDTDMDNNGVIDCIDVPVQETPELPSDVPTSVVPSDSPTPLPTPFVEPTFIPVEPQVCTMDYVNKDTGTNVCPNGSIVTLQGSLGIEQDGLMAGENIFYDISLDPSGSTVTFSINNVFSSNADIYVKHEVFSRADSAFKETSCEAVLSQSPCLSSSEEIDNTFTVACRDRGFALVWLYFATSDDSVMSFNGPDVEIPECCYPEEYNFDTTGVALLAYRIDCACPSVAPARRLESPIGSTRTAHVETSYVTMTYPAESPVENEKPVDVSGASHLRGRGHN
jgi:hypothetical protein